MTTMSQSRIGGRDSAAVSSNRVALINQRASVNHANSKQSGSSRALQVFPHQDAIESSLAHAIPGRAVLDPQACSLMNVPAFTRDRTTYFAEPEPPLGSAAHEAVHLCQHSGITRDAGLGPELHAEALASKIVRGAPTDSLFGFTGKPVNAGLRPYTLITKAEQEANKWDAGKDLKVADNGNMAAGAVIEPHNHDLWAQPSLVSSSNATLAGKNSVIRLKTLPETLKGPAPDKSGNRTLAKVVPENQANGTSGDSMKIWCDCGRAGRDVMGAGEGTGHHGERMTADYTKVHRPWYSYIPVLGPLLSLIFGGPKKEQKQTAASQPEQMKKEIFNAKLGGTGDEGLHKYEAMSPEEKDRFDKETGINRYAAPGVGQGFTMSTGGAAVPGASTWNFHWAGVVMVSGGDWVTLENYATGDPSEENAEWDFGLYGPPSKAGQTFFEEHKATGTHGTAPTAMKVEMR